MRFINPNKVYWVNNQYLGINFNGGHNVIIVWFNKALNICRVKTITSLEKEVERNGRKIYFYKYNALEKAKKGLIQPYSINELNSKHWSGIDNASKIINIDHLCNSFSKMKKPKSLIKKKSLYK